MVLLEVSNGVEVVLVVMKTICNLINGDESGSGHGGVESGVNIDVGVENWCWWWFRVNTSGVYVSVVLR